jgi:adenylate cyclase
MLWILVSNLTERERFLHQDGPLELGRGPRRDVARRVLQDLTVSNDQLRLEEQEQNQVHLCNLSKRVPVRLADGSQIEPGGERSANLPTRLFLGDTIVEIEFAVGEVPAQDLTLRTIEPPIAAGPGGPTLVPQLSDAPNTEELTRWFEALVGVERAAASSPDFFAKTARAVVELIGLDNGLVLLRREGDWVSVAAHHRNEDADDRFSRSVLETVTRERRTFFQCVPSNATAASLKGVVAVVASPILNEAQEVIGAVYGARRGTGSSPKIRPLEAQLTQVLAAAVAAGLARLESEAQAARRRVQFEQFFTPELSAALDRDPALLDGIEREVTVLFADVRDYSALSERLSARQTCELIRAVMEHLTAKVMQFAGVVVTYIGDGLLAMWNAPLEQPDHAVRACRAALAMRDGLPELNRTWDCRLGCALRLGIGINSGPALVGNTGSPTKFNYGPLGHAVNLASRVEGATKHLGVSLLITGSTRYLLGRSFATRRLCRARIRGLAGEVDLYELHAETASTDWQSWSESYERALALYEAGKWGESCQVLFPFLSEVAGTYDLPSVSLLSQALECLKARPTQFEPVLDLRSI